VRALDPLMLDSSYEGSGNQLVEGGTSNILVNTASHRVLGSKRNGAQTSVLGKPLRAERAQHLERKCCTEKRLQLRGWLLDVSQVLAEQQAFKSHKLSGSTTGKIC